jgi:hypothetical protein
MLQPHSQAIQMKGMLTWQLLASVHALPTDEAFVSFCQLLWSCVFKSFLETVCQFQIFDQGDKFLIK